MPEPLAVATPGRVKRQPASPLSSSLPSPSPSPPPREPIRTLLTTTSLTTIHVGSGPRTQTFLVHTPFLTHSSAWFATALSPLSNFQEATTNTISLPEICPRTFGYFMQWLYSGNLAHEEVDWKPAPTRAESPTTSDDGVVDVQPTWTNMPGMGASPFYGPDGSDAVTHPRGKAPRKNREVAFFHLIRLYNLAGYLQHEGLKNSIVDEVARVAVKRNAVPGPDDTCEIWTANPGNAGKLKGLGSLVVDLFAGMRTEKLLREGEGWAEGFLKELVARQGHRGQDVVVSGVPEVKAYVDRVLRCQRYHEHVETEACQRWVMP